ncbi:PulJ/GspJ family protein [Candidatus Protochlamydia phocaeensis]|uniref:PulJ/GspJ family protein n=1 Tax=Candidatus Protochlamydia phocaeensis TaxID=1414722 RepID=UPI0008383BC8|nr:hypothetical protein [Candidatus Protochlamydia phocaeensis]
MKCKRKQHLTLLETLIAISLLAAILTIVFGFFRELAEIHRQTEVQQKESFQMRYAETRLNFIFERLVNENKETKENFYFFTQAADRGFSNHPSLVFSFDNEARANPVFSGDILARLYVDLDHRLCLAMWPFHMENPHADMQKEVLLENVSHIRYEFYAAPERMANEKGIYTNRIDPQKLEPEKDRWHEEWFKTYNQMPSIMKITVSIADDSKAIHKFGKAWKKDRQLTFAFVLPSSKNFIYYPPN